MRWEQKSYSEWKDELDTFLVEHKILDTNQVVIINSIREQLKRMLELDETASSKFIWHCRGTINATFSKLYDTVKIENE